MSSIKNVAIAGASGDLGTPVFDAIVNSGKFNVTVLVRSSSKATFPSSIKVVEVDFTSVESLTKALKGQDALVSTVGTPGLQGQTLMIDASIAAGVKRFLPSEFGSDLSNPKTRALPVFGYKVAVVDYAVKQARAHPEFSYTFVRTGAFLDWGLQKNVLLDTASGKPRIFDDGERLFSTTTLASIGLAVVGVLSHPDETKNRVVSVQNMATSQNKILAIAKRLAPNKTFEPVYVDTDEMWKSANERIAKGDFSHEVLFDHITVSLFGKDFGGLMPKTDNELLGVPSKGEAEIEAILKPLLGVAN